MTYIAQTRAAHEQQLTSEIRSRINTGRRRRLQRVRVTHSKGRWSLFCVFRRRLRLSAAGHCHVSIY